MDECQMPKFKCQIKSKAQIIEFSILKFDIHLAFAYLPVRQGF